MRIVGGRHRGRRLKAPKGNNTRPTSDAVREAVFNALSHWDPPPIANGLVLDLFAGTGAMGLEALSRGARHVTFVDSDPAAAAAIRANIAGLGEENNTQLVTGDVRRLPKARQHADLVFLDPPYGLGLVKDAVEVASQKQWLGPASLLVIEMGVSEKLTLPDGFQVLWKRNYRQSQVVVARLTL